MTVPFYEYDLREKGRIAPPFRRLVTRPYERVPAINAALYEPAIDRGRKDRVFYDDREEFRSFLGGSLPGRADFAVACKKPEVREFLAFLVGDRLKRSLYVDSERFKFADVALSDLVEVSDVCHKFS